jgi:hypothetical protein
MMKSTQMTSLCIGEKQLMSLKSYVSPPSHSLPVEFLLFFLMPTTSLLFHYKLMTLLSISLSHGSLSLYSHLCVYSLLSHSAAPPLFSPSFISLHVTMLSILFTLLSILTMEVICLSRAHTHDWFEGHHCHD